MGYVSAVKCKTCGMDFVPKEATQKFCCWDCFQASLHHKSLSAYEQQKSDEQKKQLIGIGCKKCKYIGRIGSFGYYCNYLDYTNHSRDVPAGICSEGGPGSKRVLRRSRHEQPQI